MCVDLGGVQKEHAVIADGREDALGVHVPRHIRHREADVCVQEAEECV